MNILNEVYYSNNENITKMEKCFKSIHDKQKKNPKLNPNDFPEIKKLEKLIETTFNFEKVFFSITGDAVNMNACTLPFLYNAKHKENKKTCAMIQDKKGIRYKDSTGKQIMVQINVYNIINLTPRENMTILLHEIGHNFFIYQTDFKFSNLLSASKNYIQTVKDYIKLTLKMKTLDPSLTLLLIILLLYFIICINSSSDEGNQETFEQYLERVTVQTKKFYTRYYQITNDYNEKIKAKKKKDINSSSIKKLIMKISKYTGMTLEFLIETPLNLLFLPITFLKGKLSLGKDYTKSYDNEKFADNFAISYGYGKELASVFNNIYKNEEVEEFCKNRYAKFLNEFSYLNTIIKYYTDCHPSGLFRVEYAKKKLEYELNNNKYLSEGEKEQIRKDIQSIKKIREEDLAIYHQFTLKWNSVFNFDQKKDDIASNYTDEEIFDFNTGVNKKYF